MATATATATETLLAKLPRCARTHLCRSAADSGSVALDHFSWAKRPERIVPSVSRLVRKPGLELAA